MFITLEKAKSNTENIRDSNLAEVKITIFQVSKLPSQKRHDLQYRLTQHTADSADCTFVYKPQKYN